MTIALFHRHYDEQHLQQVMQQMQTLGAPTIKAVWMENYQHWVALEGTHRILAAKMLGITPIIDDVDYDDSTFTADDGDIYTISEVCYDSYQCKRVNF
jgi:hypothetical protein